MQLPFLTNKKEEKDYFLALLFKPHKISGILFEQIHGKLTILDSKEEYVGSGIDSLTEEQLIETCDLVISTLEGVLEEGVFVKKTVFGVPYSWVEESKIKKEYLNELKKICQELELTPMGFIVPIEAVVHYLQEKEGAPVSGVFVERLDKRVIVYVIKASKIIGVNAKKIGENFAQSVEHTLKEIDGLSVLPSKMTLLDYDGVESVQQEFLNYQWTAELPFLHIPDIKILEKQWEDEAIINGVAMQMGFEVESKTIPHHTDMHEARHDSQIEKPSQHAVDSKGEEVMESDEEGFENFGFLKNVDVLEKQAEEVEKEDEKHVVNKPDEEDEDKPSVYVHEVNEGNDSEVSGDEESKQKLLSSVTSKFSVFTPEHIFSKLKVFRLPKKPKLTSIKFLVFPFVVIGAVILFSNFYYNSILQTDIILFMNIKSFNETKSVTLSPKNDTSVEDAVLKINEITIEEQGELSKQTTGKKETGEKATGELIIYNKTEQGKTFSKGTILTGPNNLQFQLENDATVASTSAFATSMSSVKAKVTAANFGSEYNLSSNTNFSFKDFPTSSYFAKNDNAFTGGTKRDLNVVSKKDLDDLTGNISNTLKEKAQNDLKSKIGSGDSLLPYITSSDFVSKTFDKKEGEEASKVKITAKMSFTGNSYSKSEVENFAKEVTENSVPENYHIDTEKSKIEVRDIKMDKNNKISGTIVISNVYLPTINVEDIKERVVKQEQKNLQGMFRNVKGISDYQVKMRNKLPLFPDVMPSNVKNVTITTKMDE